jgi:hypothetical protein
MNTEKNDECCCGPAAREHIAYKPLPVAGRLSTSAGDIVRIATGWQWRDYLGMIAVRLGFHRMEYAVSPGLYAVGHPDQDAPVLLSANYKLSFDVLRRELAGLDVWVLVIDTKGVNVWCAAGKGTFGTMEIVKRVAMTELGKIVRHRQLIAPQLGAPGIAAHIVRAFSDFAVLYGPVRANDIPRYLYDGMKADSGMRRVSFGVIDRLDIVWLEMTRALKTGIVVSLALFLVMGIGLKGFSPALAWERSSMFIGWIAAAIVSGTLLTAILLPWLPGKAFSLKGGFLGAVAGILIALPSAGTQAVAPLLLSSMFFVSAGSAYLALNYTGCTTYTSPSGVKKEIRYALPVIIGTIVLSVLLQILGRI